MLGERGPHVQAVLQALHLKAQHSGINLDSSPAYYSGGTDGRFSALKPREGDYPIWLRLAVVLNRFPFPGRWFAKCPEARIPICPEFPSCHKPTGCALLIWPQRG